jgi:hypothetical protein
MSYECEAQCSPPKLSIEWGNIDYTYISNSQFVCMENPLIIMVRDCDLTDDESKKSRILEDMREALSDVLTEYDVEEEEEALVMYDGHIYAQTNDHVHCPDCQNPLELREVQLGPENGADALASCSCGWSGRAVYRLIDLEEETEDGSEDGFTEMRSCVAHREMRVSYSPYENTDLCR